MNNLGIGINYIHVSYNLEEIFDKNGNFFYDRDCYREKKIIIDLPLRIMNSECYDINRRYCKFLENKGYTINFKGICGNNMFGLPINKFRYVIVGNKNGSNILINNLFIPKDEYSTPISLIYGKKLPDLRTIVKNQCKGNVDSENFDKYFEKFNEKYFDISLMKDFIDKAVDLTNRKDFKFTDGSHDLNKGSRRTIRNNINGSDRINPLKRIDLYSINDDDCNKFYHWHHKRDYMTIREIARLDGYPDNWQIKDFNEKNRMGFVDYISEHLSPFIINKIWGIIY